MQPSFTHPPLSFDDNLRAFVERKIPCEILILHLPPKVYPDFDAWLREIATKAPVVDCLRDLHSRFGILPAPVLLILAKTWFLISTRPVVLNRDSRKRRTDIAVLTKTLKVLQTYPAANLFLCSDGLLVDTQEMENEPAVKAYLETLKRAIGMIKPHKQSDVEIRFCAQTLREFFRNLTGKNTLDEHVGNLLVHALNWPRGHSENLGNAALKRANDASIIAKQFTLEEALDLQNHGEKHQRFWRQKEKELSLILKESRTQRKAQRQRAKLRHAEWKKRTRARGSLNVPDKKVTLIGAAGILPNTSLKETPLTRRQR